MSTLHRELCGIVSALQTYEHYIIGSPFPIYLYCDHKPILYLLGRKGQLSHRFFKYQVIITKFHNLKIIWTPGSNLPFPDILSRNITLSGINKLQLQHKEIPKEISFYDEKGDQMHYTFKHEDISCKDFFPIICQHGNDGQILHLKNDGDFTNESGNNWSKVAPKFAFAHNTSANYTTRLTPYEIVFGTKPQVPMTLKLGLIRDKNEQCRSEYCEGLKPHTRSENQLPNKSLDRLLRPQLSDELIARENDFKGIYSSTYQRCRQITSKAHEYRNRFKLGRPINIKQKVFLENHTADLSRSQKLKQLRIGPFTVTKQRIRPTKFKRKLTQIISKLLIAIT